MENLTRRERQAARREVRTHVRELDFPASQAAFCNKAPSGGASPRETRREKGLLRGSWALRGLLGHESCRSP